MQTFRVSFGKKSILYIVFWYLSSIFGVLYSKWLFDFTHDPHTLTLVSLFYAVLMKLTIFRSSRADLKCLLLDKHNLCLALLYLASMLFTNIGICLASATITFMIKASEPLFVVIISFIMREKTSHSIRVILMSFISIIIGLLLIFSEADKFTRDSYICAFLANLASSSLFYFYNTINHSSLPSIILKSSLSEISPFLSFVNMGFVSFLIFIPFYIIQNLVSIRYYSTNFLIEYYNHVFDYTLSPFSNPKVVSCFLLASLFNFASFFFSLKTFISTFNNVSLHSVLNNVRRILIVTCSTFILAEFVQPMQWIGMKFIFAGVLFYSFDAIFNSSSSSSISLTLPSSIVIILNETRRLFKICLVVVISFAVLMSCYPHPRRYLPYEYDSHSVFVSPRLECINKIQNETETIIRPLIPKQGRFLLFDYPTHHDLDDSILWFGEELYIFKSNLIASYL